MPKSALFKLKAAYIFSKPSAAAKVKGSVIRAAKGAKSMTVKIIKAKKEKVMTKAGEPLTVTFLKLDASTAEFGGMWISDKDPKSGKTLCAKVKSAAKKAAAVAAIVSPSRKATVAADPEPSAADEVSKEAHRKAVEEVKQAAAHRHKTLSRWVRAGTRAATDAIGHRDLEKKISALSQEAARAKDEALAAQMSEVTAANEADLAAQLDLQRRQHELVVSEKAAEIEALEARTATLVETEAAAIRATVDCIVIEVALLTLRQEEAKFGVPPPRRSPRKSPRKSPRRSPRTSPRRAQNKTSLRALDSDGEGGATQQAWPADGRIALAGKKKRKGKREALKLKARRAAWKKQNGASKQHIASPTRAKTNPIAMLAMTEMQREVMLLRYPLDQAQEMRERWAVMLARHAGEKAGFGGRIERFAPESVSGLSVTKLPGMRGENVVFG